MRDLEIVLPQMGVHRRRSLSTLSFFQCYVFVARALVELYMIARASILLSMCLSLAFKFGDTWRTLEAREVSETKKGCYP